MAFFSRYQWKEAHLFPSGLFFSHGVVLPAVIFKDLSKVFFADDDG